ncbi:putative glucose-6-phosphate 1-epimerase [Nicotiana tabacum]|uniref:glucose-6-phosphate 1-epimerase n=2 Tax=Nicotiana tabacum TaxID=4097 RepID=A0A1S4ANY6_TOBAC|nr:PREDICTED: putative glucose-6-phosphate 1-epimerase [Nicotiana tabacum]
MPFDVVDDSNGFPRVLLSDPGGSSAEVLLYGGQVVSWKNERGEELLFRSTKALAKSPNAYRGGISVSISQLGATGRVLQHGLVCQNLWSLDSSPLHLPSSGSQSSIDLIFQPVGKDLKTWPCSFELRLHVSLGPGRLKLIPSVRNTDNKSLSFTFGLRNYLSVSDISEVRIEGLETLDYLDLLLQKQRFTEQADAITFDREVHRVYLSTPPKVAIIDHEKKRTFVLRKEGLPDTVLWNPWDKIPKAIPDFGVEDYKIMMLVDSAAFEKPIELKPHQEWKCCQEIVAVSSSYCSGQLDPQMVLHGLS